MVEIEDLPDELLMLILMFAGGQTRHTALVSQRWQRLVSLIWSRLHWHDGYNPRMMEGKALTRANFPADFPVCRAMLAAINGERPPVTCMQFKGPIKKLLWNTVGMFEARCEREIVYGAATTHGVTRWPFKKPGVWKEVEARGKMQAEPKCDPPRQITVDGRTYDFGESRGVYGGWSMHGRLFFLTRGGRGIQFERVYMGDHSIFRPGYQPTHVIITDHTVLFFYYVKPNAHLICFQYR